MMRKRNGSGDVVTVSVDALTEAVEAAIREAGREWRPSSDEVAEIIAAEGWTLEEVGFDLQDLDVSEVVQHHALGDLMQAVMEWHGESDAISEIADTYAESLLPALCDRHDNGTMGVTTDAFKKLQPDQQQAFVQWALGEAGLPTVPTLPPEPSKVWTLALGDDVQTNATSLASAAIETIRNWTDPSIDSHDFPRGEMVRMIWDALMPHEKATLMAHAFMSLTPKK